MNSKGCKIHTFNCTIIVKLPLQFSGGDAEQAARKLLAEHADILHMTYKSAPLNSFEVDMPNVDIAG